MKEILEAGGGTFLLPSVLFVLVLYAVRGVFGLHGRRGQHRREFLELWDKSRTADDLWLEVAVKHLFGAFLPAHVIRLALDQPDRSRSLADLSGLWDVLTFNPDDQTVRWASALKVRVARSRFGRSLCFAAYMSCALAALLAGVVAAHYGHTSLFGWVYGVGAVVVAFLAFICLTYEETVSTARSSGDRWIALINSSATTNRAKEETRRRDLIHAMAQTPPPTTEPGKAL